MLFSILLVIVAVTAARYLYSLLPSRATPANYGEWALVVGASAGIGEAICRQLSARGFKLVLVARKPEPLEKLAAELDTECKVVTADAGSVDGIKKIIAGVTAAGVEPGLLATVAGIETMGYFIDGDDRKHETMINLNCVAPAMLSKHFGAGMASRGRGGILLVSSLSGHMHQPYMSLYGATKAFTSSLGESLFLEMKDKNVDVAVLSPGPVATEMIANNGLQLGKFGINTVRAEQAARAGLDALGKFSLAIPSFQMQANAAVFTSLPRVVFQPMAKWMQKTAVFEAIERVSKKS